MTRESSAASEATSDPGPGAAAEGSPRPWSRTTQLLLLGAGALLALVAFVTVLTMPDLPYHPARDLELRATYDAYRDTGVALVKENGTGSWYGQLPGEGLTKAAGDDDPGSYLIASWMSHVTGSASPYPGLIAVMAVLCALPWLLLPLTVARIFGRARAGFAMLGLPLLTWLVDGSLLLGTEYGESDLVSPVRVYALYGLPSAAILLSLVLVAFVLTHRIGWRVALAMTVLLVALATAGNLLRSMSGFGIAALVAVVWWTALRGRGRGVALGGAAAGLVVAVAGALVLPGVVVDRIDARRAEVISPETARLPDAHGTWHPLYLGLSYPQPITGQPSEFGVQWSDEFGWAKARETDPDVVPASTEYDEIIGGVYRDAVRDDPWGAARLYAAKLGYTAQHFAGLLVLLGLGALLAWRRRIPSTGAVRGAVSTVPTVVLGLAPPVLVMPMLYYYSELVAALGFLSALALGALVVGLSGLRRSGAGTDDLVLPGRHPIP